MASFFQPAVYDPSAELATSAAASTASRFLVYTNSTLVGSGILANWYQYLLLIVGATALGGPFVKWLVQGLWSARRRRKQAYSQLRTADDKDEDDDEDLVDDGLLSFKQEGPTAPRQSRFENSPSLTSFGLFLRGDLHEFLSFDYDLHVIDLDSCSRDLLENSQELTREGSEDQDDRCTAGNVWALVDEIDWSSITSSQMSLTSSVGKLQDIKADCKLSGFVISSKIARPSKLHGIIRTLVSAGIPCMLMEDAGEPSHVVAPSLIHGVIYRNACILANGLRRDFFQAVKLRNSLGRYENERKQDPKFFVGFLDLWASRPLPSIVRRSYKFAKFHGAVIHHESAGSINQRPHKANGSNAFSAFDWLKRRDLMQAQTFWKSSLKPVFDDDEEGPDDIVVPDNEFLLLPLEDAIPDVYSYFELSRVSDYDRFQNGLYQPPNYIPQAPKRGSFWTHSSQGDLMCAMGCYDLREELYDEQYEAIVQTQKHLLRLNMLEALPEKDIKAVCSSVSQAGIPSSIYKGILSNLSGGLLSGEVKVYRGLDTGFRLPDNRGHFWAVSAEDDQGQVFIFMSRDVPNFVTAVIHTYLAHRGISRRSRFDIELSVLNHDVEMHPRVDHELQSATYAELLYMLEQIMVASQGDRILESAKDECIRLLVDEASNRAWNNMHSNDFLARKISFEEVLKTRYDYLMRRGSKYLPKLENMVAFYHHLDELVLSALYEGDETLLATLTLPLLAAENESAFFNDSADLYGLIFFSTLRRRAYEEVFMETTDRCPLFLQQHDQAAVFAELWVLGSQCEVYFGIKPRALGAIIYDEYRTYLEKFPPSLESWNGMDVFTAYHKARGDEVEDQIAIGSTMANNPTAAVPLRARLAKASFLTIFCVPAIIDVGLLTFLGRGLYLTAFMTLQERVMANYAVLASLVMTAGVTGWSGSSGGFYLYQSAFHNMNHFMVQRLSGGFMIAALLAVCGFVAFGVEYSWYGGFIFAAYTMVLSTYLNLLGIMATMHRDGAPFQSGRLVLARCLLITLISPIITSFVNGYDVLVYLLVLYAFLITLLISYSRLCDEWSSWPEKVPIVKEAEILKWHELWSQQHEGQNPETLGSFYDLGGKSRSGFFEQIKARISTLWTHSNVQVSEADVFFEKLATSHPYVVWLLEKESNGQALPAPYTTTWLVQTKLALTNQQQLNRGLKEHSPFLLFRMAKYDLAQNVGLFLIALLDRWIAVSMSANGVVVNVYYNVRARYGIAFGLLYFLLCAVSLDVVLQRYWGKTGRRSSEKLGNIFEFEETEANETRVEKKRWLTAISELIWVMIAIFGLMTIFVWLFVVDSPQVILYFAYIVGYSGVIIFQFNRVFTTDIRMHVQIVFMAAFGGYVLGVILHEVPASQDFRFNDVIALCAASLSAAIGTWLYTDFCDDPAQEIHISNEDLVNWKVYSQKLVGMHDTSCSISAGQLANLSGINCHYEDSSILSEAIKKRFTQALRNRDDPIRSTFIRAQEMLEYTLRIWRNNQLRLIIVDRKSFTYAGGGTVFAASTKVDGALVVYVGMPAINAWKDISASSYEALLAQLASEAMLHESCEAMMHLRHSDATLAELLLNNGSSISTRMAVQLAWADAGELASIISNTNLELVSHLALGIDLNVKWESTPEDVRMAVVSRVIGQEYPRSIALESWLSSRSDNIQLHDWYTQQCLSIREVAISKSLKSALDGTVHSISTVQDVVWNKHATNRNATKNSHLVLHSVSTSIYEFLFTLVEFVAIVTTSGSDAVRELWYVLRYSPLQVPILWIVAKLWKVCLMVRYLMVRYILLTHDSTYIQFEEWTVKGPSRTLRNGILHTSDPRYEKTGFLSEAIGGIEMTIFAGRHTALPDASVSRDIASYDASMRLMRLVTIDGKSGHSLENHCYNFASLGRTDKYPISRVTRIDEQEYKVFYDEHGRITHGDCSLAGTRYNFAFDYALMPAGSLRILRAMYTLSNVADSEVYTVYWCKASEMASDDVRTWTPTSRVAKVVKMTKRSWQETSFTYEHKRDPSIVRTTYARSSSQIQEIENLLRFDDEMGLLQLPDVLSFVDEDLLFYHHTTLIMNESHLKSQSLFHSLAASFHRRKRFVSKTLLTSATLRSILWKRWASRTDMNAVVACMLDELILRREARLRNYWALRDAGQFYAAKASLLKDLEGIVAEIELSDDASQKTPIAIRPTDLFVMGLSKDSNFVTTEPEETYIDTEDRVAVIFTDTGCWPDAPGGVSNCRRDLVDGHTTIRNYALTESANEYGIPRFQIERNIQVGKNLPLWGLDGKSPCHGLYDNLLQMQVERRIRRTRLVEDIEGTFVPLLNAVVRGSRTLRFTSKDLSIYTMTFLNINKYFEENDYLTTWRSKAVRKAWREAWLCEYEDENISNPNDSLQIERPTAGDFDEALELYISYFFVFSIRVPEEVPRVYQSTHHGISSLYGMILKLRRGTTWGIWDHAIMWRESCLNISPAQCILPISVQTMLLGAMKLAANLAYTHADVILPCTAIYNPTWETELGTDQGRRSSPKLYARKIDPITNGISNMDFFKPVQTIRTTEPTTIMLSNVQFIKDVKNAILAAGVIINEFGFKNYNLVVYGAQDRQPSYAIETAELINSLGIGNTVRLGGFGSPKEVLKDAWLFMNSSLSEGLPLAIGEAALSGIPIVATEVGATAQVLTDPDDPNVLYGEVVPPNDPVALARAQIGLLAMLGPWAKYTDDDLPPPPLPTTFTTDDVEWITSRMYQKTDDRRALGLKLREVVLRKFSGERYLREHEQMYWVQRHMSQQRASDRLSCIAASHPRLGQPLEPRLVEVADPCSMWNEERWQDFPVRVNRGILRIKKGTGSSPTGEEERMLADGEGGAHSDEHI